MVGVPTGDGDEEVVAAVVLAPGAVLDPEAVRTQCRAHIAAYKVPRRVFAVDALPVSIIGKVLRRKVREELLARLETNSRLQA